MKKFAVFIIALALVMGCIGGDEDTTETTKPETPPQPETTTPPPTTTSVPTTMTAPMTAAPTTTAPPTTNPPTTTPTPPSPVEGYIILTNIVPEDPFYKGVLKLREYREASIVSFDTDVQKTREELRNRNVTFAAIMVRPETIDEDFVYDVFQLAKEIEPEYTTDFAYGFITGITPEDMVQYVENVIRYEAGYTTLNSEFRAVWRTGEGAVGGGVGGWGDQITQEMVDIFHQLGFDTTRIDTDNISKSVLLSTLRQSGVLYFLLHGSSSSLLLGDEIFLATDVSTLQKTFFVFNTGCYDGCTYKVYNQGISAPATYEERAYYGEINKSLPLIFLRNNTLGYVGHMCMWGSNNWPVILMEALKTDEKLTLGEMIIEWYNVPPGTNIIMESAASDIVGMDRNRFQFATVILYGDPALHILQN